MIKPWIVRGYDNDSRWQRIWFFDNGYGASTIPEVDIRDGYNMVVIQQIDQSEAESQYNGKMTYSNGLDHNCTMYPLYMVLHGKTMLHGGSYLNAAQVQANLAEIRSWLPLTAD